VYQADAWLDGKTSIDPPVPGGWGNDWAKVETVELDDGTVVRGRRVASRKVFQVIGGDDVALARIRAPRGETAYMSFPPLPAVLMMPAAIAGGRRGNDVFPSLLVAALCLPLMFAALKRLNGHVERSMKDQLWLVGVLAFGSVFFFSAVQGQVWYTAHVVGVALAAVYAWAAIDARRPIVAGIALGLAAITRPPMAFMFPLFVMEAWRVAGGLTNRRDLFVRLARFAAPVVAIAVAAGAYNYARFGSFTEFGHSYLDVRQQAQIEAHGLFSYQYLARNLAVAFTLLPEIVDKSPGIQISGHGLAIWFTTPILLWLLWPQQRGAVHRALWVTVAFVAVPTLFYQNSGWVQFGYRFSLDYMPFLVLLLAVGARKLTWVAKGLIIAGVVINLFGAITFNRFGDYYRTQGNAYGTIVAH
jgi:hypothetical protein